MGFFPGAEAPGTGDMHDHCLPHPALLGEAAAWEGGVHGATGSPHVHNQASGLSPS